MTPPPPPTVHILWLVLGIGQAGARPSEVEGIVDCTEEGVVFEGGRIGDAVRHGAAQGTREKFMGGEEALMEGASEFVG